MRIPHSRPQQEQQQGRRVLQQERQPDRGMLPPPGAQQLTSPHSPGQHTLTKQMTSLCLSAQAHSGELCSQQVCCPCSSGRSPHSFGCRVYSAGEAGPVIFCLHGAGYTGLTWSMLAARLKDRWGSAQLPHRAIQGASWHMLLQVPALQSTLGTFTVGFG